MFDKRSIRNNFSRLILWVSVFCISLVVGSVASLHASDKDDFYAEAHVDSSLNKKGRYFFGSRVGYTFQNDLGLGLIYEQHLSQGIDALDSSFYRMGMEFRWFQEPFEFAASFGVGNRNYRDGRSLIKIIPALSAAYLWALTPSLAALVDFSFLFLDDPRVIFSAGLGARILF